MILCGSHAALPSPRHPPAPAGPQPSLLQDGEVDVQLGQTGGLRAAKACASTSHQRGMTGLQVGPGPDGVSHSAGSCTNSVSIIKGYSMPVNFVIICYAALVTGIVKKK